APRTHDFNRSVPIATNSIHTAAPAARMNIAIAVADDSGPAMNSSTSTKIAAAASAAASTNSSPARTMIAGARRPLSTPELGARNISLTGRSHPKLLIWPDAYESLNEVEIPAHSAVSVYPTHT